MTQPAKLTVSDEVAIDIQSMNKWYGAFHVLRDINLTVNRGERIVVCGPSGSGKSTLIRCINALEEHQQGKITVDGTVLSSDLKNIDKIRSEVGMCFQHFNLFPHLTILENCTLAPIWVRKTPKKEAELFDEIKSRYDQQVSPYYSAARLWTDAVIDPTDTRDWISMGIEAANHAPIEKAFNMGVIQV